MLFTFPSRYSFAIGLTRVFSLTGWSRQIRAGFLVSRVTQDTTKPEPASRKGLSPAMAGLSRPFRSPPRYYSVVLQPRPRVATRTVWALPRSLATTGGIIVYFLFLRVLRCFSSPRWPLSLDRCHAFSVTGCPIRKSRGQGIFAPNPCLSQLITSFVA